MKAAKWFQAFVIATQVMALVIAGVLAPPAPVGQRHGKTVIVITGECVGDVCG